MAAFLRSEVVAMRGIAGLQPEVVLVPGVFAAVLISSLLLLRSLFFKVVRQWSERRGSTLGDSIATALGGPSLLWCIAIGLHVGVGVSGLPEKYISYISKSIHVIIILSVTVAIANLSGRIYLSYVQRAGLHAGATGLVYGMARGVIFTIGALIILSVLGVSITPLLTALGVGGLAVALALQDTLANLFAGIHILMERSVRVGDFIRLETGQEGYVEDITWRTTRIKMLPNNMVVIPNNKLSQSIVTNYYLPDRKMAVQIPVRVDYSSDPEKVERVLRDLVRGAQGEIPGLLAEPEPSVSLIPGFGERALEFSLSCYVGEYTDQFIVQHELRKRIFRRFAEEGIVMQPQPQTVYVVKQDR
jgi:small-conductance mechanosensitive channel